MTRIEEIIQYLTHRKANIQCNGSDGLILLLEEIGFLCKHSKRGEHKIFTHAKLSLKTQEFKPTPFYTHSIDCGHYPNKPMKRNYITDTINLLKRYQTLLEEINNETT